MELYKKQLINILNSSINGKKFSGNSEEIYEWNKIIQEADKHDISALIYYSIDKETLRGIENHLLNKWKVSVLKSNITQIHFLNCVKEILLDLQGKGVKVIVLKGVILKDFYPRPEFRTMGDLDILIDIKDYNLVKKYLKSIGYNCEKAKHPVHVVFYSENRPDVEVHWKLVNENYYIGDEKEFERNVWKNAKEVKIYDLKFITFSDEDFLIHICMHMAVHAKCSGFGLRQLYDLALFTKNKYEDIDWESFKDRIYKYGILTFTEGLYALCDKIFEIEVPYFDLKNTRLKEEHINLLLENIICSGVYGKGKENIDFDVANESSTFHNKFKKNMQIIFKSRKELSQGYSYVKIHFYLLPVVLGYRIFKTIKKKLLTNILKYMNKTVGVKENKNEIVNIFKL